MLQKEKNNLIIQILYLISEISNYAMLFILSLVLFNHIFPVFDNYIYFDIFASVAIAFFWIIAAIFLKFEEMEEFYMPKLVKFWTIFIYPTVFVLFVILLVVNNVIVSTENYMFYNLLIVAIYIICFVIESHITIKYCVEALEHYVKKE